MTYLATVIADSPLHYWRCADGGGQIAHDIGSDPFHLIASDAAGRLGYSGPNSDGGGLICPGGGADLNSAGGVLNSLTSPFTVECWFWMFAAPGAFADLVGWAAFNAGLTIQLNANRTLQVTLGGTFPAQSGAYSQQHWHQAVMTYDGATIKQFTDGAASTTVAKVGPVTVTQQLAIGADPNRANSFEGVLSEISIYGTALSLARVTAHYAAVDQPGQSPVYIEVAGNQSAASISGGAAGAGALSVVTGLTRNWANTP